MPGPRLLAAVVVALIACAAPAAAQAPMTYEPGPDAAVQRDSPVQLTVRPAEPAAGVQIGVSPQPEVDDRGLLRELVAVRPAQDAGGGAFTATFADEPFFTARPGTYYWQGVLSPPDGSGLRPGPVIPIHVTVPPEWTERRPIPRAIGRRSRGGTVLVSARGRPAGVPARRFRSLVRSAARRWGLKARGWSTRFRAGRHDGRNVIGFGTVPGERLGLMREVRRVRRGRSRVVERDVVIRPGVEWNVGPRYPTLEEFDLETVIIHELGHYVGNLRHAPMCTNSPMVEAASPGQWWHTPQDFWWGRCGGATAARL